MSNAPKNRPVSNEPRAKYLKALRPRDARSALRSEYGRASRVGRERAELSQSELAAELEVAKPFIGHSELDGDRPVPNVLHVASSARSPAARVWASEVVRWQAAQLALVVLEQTRVVHGEDHGARLASVTVRCTDLPREFAVALADQRLTLDELEQLERRARETAEAALEAQAAFAAEIKRRREPPDA